jgi:pilus assembly protein Flp/PilA
MQHRTLRDRVRPAGKHRQKDRGASLVEYALLVSLIAIVCFAVVVFLGNQTGDSFSRTGDSIQAT